MLGFGGHWSTKSRRYSTTMGALRRARVQYAKRRRARDRIPLDAWGRAEDDQVVIVIASWVYVGSATRPKGSGGWPCRRRPVPASSDASPGRS
jgi:hypothetical protein